MSSPSRPASAAGAVAPRLVERIGREGPLPFDAFMAEALVGAGGFFTTGRGAGRAGADFVTSPEVGPLFGRLVARGLDGWWDELGRPDPFVVVEAGAGRGRLAADVLAAEPACGAALRYVLVERSPQLRAGHGDLLDLEPAEDALGPSEAAGDGDELVAVARAGPLVVSLDDLPSVAGRGVVLANELLDNLPFRIVEWGGGGWLEVRVGHDGADFVESVVAAAPELAAEAAAVAAGPVSLGVRLPVPTGARAWLHRVGSTLTSGFVVLVDYFADTDALAARGQDGWLRTFRHHERGRAPLSEPGSQDITADLPRAYVERVAAGAGLELVLDASQAEWLAGLGLDEQVDGARAQWRARAHVGDLEALRHRSVVGEAGALTDPSGLGAHRVLLFRF